METAHTCPLSLFLQLNVQSLHLTLNALYSILCSFLFDFKKKKKIISSIILVISCFPLNYSINLPIFNSTIKLCFAYIKSFIKEIFLQETTTSL